MPQVPKFEEGLGKKEGLVAQDEDSHMQEEFDSADMLKDIDEEIESQAEKLIPQLNRKVQSTHPAIMSLAASPGKNEQIKSEIEKRNLEKSKVYLKRHMLYSELKNIPVTVEQSSCLQILEDFLRNRIRTMDHVKDLKFDYGGFGGFGRHGRPSKGVGSDQMFKDGFF